LVGPDTARIQNAPIEAPVCAGAFCFLPFEQTAKEKPPQRRAAEVNLK
jgi:hypothetical protein